MKVFCQLQCELLCRNLTSIPPSVADIFSIPPTLKRSHLLWLKMRRHCHLPCGRFSFSHLSSQTLRQRLGYCYRVIRAFLPANIEQHPSTALRRIRRHYVVATAGELVLVTRVIRGDLVAATISRVLFARLLFQASRTKREPFCFGGEFVMLGFVLWPQ